MYRVEKVEGRQFCCDGPKHSCTSNKMPRRAACTAAAAANDTVPWTTHLPSDMPCTATGWYDTATPSQRLEALQLGAHVFQVLQGMKASEEVQAAQAAAAAETARIREAHAAAITALQDELAAASAAHTAAMGRAAAAAAADRETTQAASAAQLATVHGELRKLQERCEALVERKRALEEGRDADIRVAEERTRVLLQTTLDEKERAIQRAERTLQTLQSAYEKQSDELRSLADLLRKKPAAGSKAKGDEYESAFRTRLVAAFGIGPRFKLVDTAASSIGHAGDYLMHWDDHVILWEVKNYDRTVPSAEVEKFRRDMKENAQVRVGVMISRLTPITGKTSGGDFEIEIYEGKLLLYISSFEAMPDDTLPGLMLYFKLWWSLDKGRDGGDDEEAERLATAIRQIEKLAAEASKARVEWRLHKSRLDETIRWIAERVEDTENRLKAALSVLQKSCGVGVAVDVPAGLFRDVSGDVKAAADVAAVLRYARAEVDGVCLLNDLADAVSKEKGISRDTARAHIRAVLLDEVLETPKGKPAKVKGLVLLESGSGTGTLEHV
jgi:hypothetical protein